MLLRRCLNVDWHQHTANVKERLAACCAAQEAPCRGAEADGFAQPVEIVVVLLEQDADRGVVEHSAAAFRLEHLLDLLGGNPER